MLHKYIYLVYPSVVKIVGDTAYDKDDNIVEIDDALITQSIKEENIDKENNAYKDKRRKTYPELREQFDILFHEIDATGTISKSGSWFTAVSGVKALYPKPV